MAQFGPQLPGGIQLDPNVQAALQVYNPMMQEYDRERQIKELDGRGYCSDAQRVHLNACNDELDEPASEAQYLVISRALESRDIKRTWSKTACGYVEWTPLSYIAALYAAGALNAVEARQCQKYVKNAITGSLMAEGRGPVPRLEVFAHFWKVIKDIFSSELLPVLLPNPGNAQIAAETPVELYTRRIRTSMRTNFWQTLDAELKWRDREATLKAESRAEIDRLEKTRASEKADLLNRLSQIKKVNGRGGGGGGNNTTFGGGGTGTGGGQTTNGGGGKGGGKRSFGSTLDKYSDPQNPNRERSPYRATAREKIICEDYVSGNPNAPCKDVAKGGCCPKGRHGGSFRRMNMLNDTRKLGQNHEQLRAKATE
eukprot:g13245.t1